ncbi:MAG: hypothetical protein ABI747_02980, partial [Candidatus Moraniibacteriota bacterium]
MKMILGAFLLSCFLFTPPSVLAEVNSEEERIKQTVDQFLSWYAKSEPEILHRRLLSKVRAPAISEAARFRAMFHVLECEVVLADAFLTIAEYFDGENPLIDQTRQEKQAFLTKRSRKLQAEAF